MHSVNTTFTLNRNGASNTHYIFVYYIYIFLCFFLPNLGVKRSWNISGSMALSNNAPSLMRAVCWSRTAVLLEQITFLDYGKLVQNDERHLGFFLGWWNCTWKFWGLDIGGIHGSAVMKTEVEKLAKKRVSDYKCHGAETHKEQNTNNNPREPRNWYLSCIKLQFTDLYPDKSSAISEKVIHVCQSSNLSGGPKRINKSRS